MGKVTQVIKRTGAIVPFTPERIANAIYRAAVAVGGRDRKTAKNLSQQVIRILESTTDDNHIPTIEEIQDTVEKVLIENGHARVAKAYILYRDERARRRKERAIIASKPSENIPWAKIWHILDWAVDNGVNTIANLNQRLANGELSDIIHVSEAAYNQDVENAAEMIGSRKNELKIVVVSGPSSSGKTTTTIKLSQRLKRMNLTLVTLNVDNYFFDLEMHPKDEFGDYDFETPQALDLTLVNEHLKSLISGDQILIPHYDFKTGQRKINQTPMQLKENQIILIDSLHGLYPEMTAGIDFEKQFKVYLEPLLQMKDSAGKYIRWTDLRLIRRMLRDASHRAYDPRQTLEHWHYVRASELRNIIPYINSVDFIINSAMPFEVCIYKKRMGDQFIHWSNDYKNNPLRVDAFERASRIAKMLQEVQPFQADESIIPQDSVIREFIGGSVYNY